MNGLTLLISYERYNESRVSFLRGDFLFSKGEKVVFQGNQYTLLWIYDNEQCEIQKEDDIHTIELTRLTELAHSGLVLELA